ncbi:MAG: DUF86 domain-containing protein [Candidatus Bathyarchaeum tardum]|nr:MAG: DUF86 domain-containing protein [Candidatus Bathyarchaeum tardum]WGM90381.1 MAG: DUF86 domain-containing protein [Candidatus Bathyarchaeum tardum]
MRDFRVYLEDMVEAINCIEEYTRGMSYEAFVKDRKTVDAVVRNFEIIGEAAKNVPNEVRKIYSNLPWKEMSGMRDKLIHAYFGVKLDVLWKTIKERLIVVKLLVEEALVELEQ